MTTQDPELPTARPPENAAGYPALFIGGAVSPRQFPPEQLPEVAFAGRSNVGKSSLLNRLLNRRHLARVSRTPGRTREINFFNIGERWIFVDLPGYGYAQVEQRQRQVWDQAIGGYLAHRRTLRAVILLLDLRRGVTPLDLELIGHLETVGVSYLPVATKIDKLKSNARRQAVTEMTRQLQQSARFALLPLVCVSSLSGDGLQDLWRRLEALLRDAREEEARTTA